MLITTAHKIWFIILACVLFISAWIGRIAISEHNNRVRAELTTAYQAKDIKAAALTIYSLQKGIELRNAIDAKQKVKTITLIRTVTTPAAIVAALPEVVTLPDAPTLQPGTGSIVIPKPDAKPLFDALANCKQDSSSLVTCQQNYAAVERENAEKDLQMQSETTIADTWKRTANGGSVIHRILNDAKYIAIGSAIGFTASKVIP